MASVVVWSWVNSNRLTSTRRACAAASALGGVMAPIAQVDGTVTDAEFDGIVSILQSVWDLDPVEATFVTEVAVNEVTPSMDAVRLGRRRLQRCPAGPGG